MNYTPNEKSDVALHTSFQVARTEHSDFSTGRRTCKATNIQIAELALAGHTVHKLQYGDFLVSKWGYNHYAQGFEALQAFAKKLGVSK